MNRDREIRYGRKLCAGLVGFATLVSLPHIEEDFQISRKMAAIPEALKEWAINSDADNIAAAKNDVTTGQEPLILADLEF